MRRLAGIALAAALSVAGAAAAARDDAPAKSVALGELLDSLSSGRGVSFVFDSRLVKGAEIAPLAAGDDLASTLGPRLQAIGLELHQTAGQTYVITKAEPAPAPAATVGGARAVEPSLDLIIVTAAASTRIEAPGADHLYTIDSDQLSLLNVNSTADAVYELPSALASFTRANTALFGALSGIDLADLRGLSPARTAVRVNGAARTLTPGGNGDIVGVDLNSLPEPFLERIEVLPAASLARHGGSAAAGVVNFATKSDLQGLRLTATGGIAERGDSERLAFSAVGGRDIFGGTGNLTGGVSLARNEGLLGVDRAETATPYGFARNGRQAGAGADFLPGFGGSPYTRTGIISAALLADGRVAPFPRRARFIPNGAAGVVPFVGSLDQLHNASAEISTIIPSDQAHAFAVATLEPSDALTLRLSAFGGLTANDVTLAPLPGTRAQGVDAAIGDAIAVDLFNPTVPAAIRQFVLDEFGPGAASLVLERRYLELGPRRQEVDRNYVDATAALERAFGENGRVELSYRFGRAGVSSTEINRVDRIRLVTALDPTACAADAACAPVDFFSPTGISQEAADYIRARPERRNISILDHEINLIARRSFGEDDATEIYAGVQLQSSTLSDRTNVLPGAVTIGAFRSSEGSATLRRGDAFAGADLEPFSENARFGALRVSLAGRLAASGAFDLAPSFDGSLTWTPADGLSLFTRQSRGTRAPNVVELFSIGDSASIAFLDPCSAPAAGSAAAANCASAGPLGVGPGFVQTAFSAPATYYGNPDLDPERLAAQSYGVDFSPTDWTGFIPGRMNLVATWNDYRIRDQIFADTDTIARCYSSPGLSDPACGVNPVTGALAILRDPGTRQIVSVDNIGTNGGRFEWRGLDLEFRYAFEPAGGTPIDRFWATILHTYTSRVRNVYLNGDIERLDGLDDYPRHRTQAVIGVEIGPLELVGSINRRGESATSRLDIPEVRLPAVIYADAAARLSLGSQIKLQFGVENLADRRLPIAAFAGGGGNSPKEHFDVVGRRYTLGIRAEF